MRPSTTEPGRGLYECLRCGHRERDPETRDCPDCGTTMRDTGKARDL